MLRTDEIAGVDDQNLDGYACEPSGIIERLAQGRDGSEEGVGGHRSREDYQTRDEELRSTVRKLGSMSARWIVRNQESV